ncbi:MAG: phosphoribosylglycinamide formyltransferase [Pseudopedobacter saltans]|uniref:Phosphoribosylglycinamide formyltransferase n=1 Tax=Pseudopedobacter saltans TaxID=151895 RepID=A0A2W5EFH6_9SPHI|nr:MAG: phosphoribosylglycinamide formyltransferase [Pseudopedobacter saltans]
MEKGHIKHIAIFASGAGSNAANLIQYFSKNEQVNIELIVCNKPNAGVLSIASDNNIPYIIIEKERFFNGDAYLTILKEYKIDFIVLAGFLWKVPLLLIQSYPNKIVNIHPALLPKYGGKGMYGAHVHEAIIANKEQETGITIHLVDEIYDNGKILFQARCQVIDSDTAETVAQKVHQLEYAHFPEQVEKWMLS